MKKDTQALLITACNIGQLVDDLHYFGVSNTRIDELISDAKKLLALAQSIKAESETTG